jgi:deoxyribonuclease-4
MKTLNQLRFGTGGIPLSTEIVKYDGRKTSGRQAGVFRTNQLGLSHMEMEFVHGVRISEHEAANIKSIAEDLNVSLTAHGSYYINLASKEKPKYYASINRVKKVISAGSKIGAKSITFHPAFYQNRPSPKVSDIVYQALMKAIKESELDEEAMPLISPETTGKTSQWGSVEEILELADRINQDLGRFAVSICVDFAHLHARSNGKNNSYEEFIKTLETIETKLGKKALKQLHIHISGIEYTEKGERKHLPIEESDLNYKQLLKALRLKDVEGWVVCESPVLEEDALLLQKHYKSIK